MKTEQDVKVLDVLKSKGFEPTVTAIREKLPFLAEANLMKLEADYGAHCHEYSTEEKWAISKAIDDCWRRIDELKDEQPELGRKPYDGKHSVADGDMPEPNIQLCIYCAENSDSVGGGAAALGTDGKWYWTHDWKLNQECKYPVTHWIYL